MWYHKFDPHSTICVPEIPLAELKPMPQSSRPLGGTLNNTVYRSETVKEFLDRSNIVKNQKSLIQQVLERSVENKESQKEEETKMMEWSKRTGLSL